MPDPGGVTGSSIDQRLAFEEGFVTLHARIRRLLAVPLDRLSDQDLSGWSRETREPGGEPRSNVIPARALARSRRGGALGNAMNPCSS